LMSDLDVIAGHRVQPTLTRVIHGDHRDLPFAGV
jgi:hypothetical protein